MHFPNFYTRRTKIIGFGLLILAALRIARPLHTLQVGSNYSGHSKHLGYACFRKTSTLRT